MSNPRWAATARLKQPRVPVRRAILKALTGATIPPLSSWTLLLASCTHTPPETSPFGSAAFGSATPGPTAPVAAEPAAPEAAPETPAGPTLVPVYAWPPPLPTATQIADARGCAVEATASARYPDTVTLADLVAAPHPPTPCDEAVYAFACVFRLGRGMAAPAACQDAFRAAILGNPALALAAGLAFEYADVVPVSGSPPFAAGPIAALKLGYSWGGLGSTVAWTLEVTAREGPPDVAVTGARHRPTPETLGADLQALGGRLGGFVAEPAAAKLVNCYDNYPDWTATITFGSGEAVSIATHGANLYRVGGPWHLDRGDEHWLQTNGDLVASLARIADALGLPFGEPMGMYCPGVDIFEQVYPSP